MGLTAAMKTLGIPELTNVFNTLLEVGGRVVLGAVIIGAGLFIANFVSKIVTQTSGDLAGKIIKYATMIIVTFMGLETMQLGEGIVDTAFRYSVMAAAVAAGVGGAIAFGLGGREWAGKKLQEWLPNKAKTTRKK
jgi:cytochrome bd-type quinol oxidase subunit 2